VSLNETKRAMFHPGQIVATPGALVALEDAGHAPSEFLVKHLFGEWGELDEKDRQLNEAALIDGSRLLSAYLTRKGERIWVITEAVDDLGRRVTTTVLKPEDY
jgi:hypothetical protein